MALVNKMENGNKTPVLYTFYEKQYNFNDLQRQADQGFNSFLSTQKRGEKDAEQFRQAYYNLMQGISDGTVKFNNGRFEDSKGRYNNSSDSDKSKDYYGLVANYIYKNMGKSGEYVDESKNDNEKSKWEGGKTIGTELSRLLYNSTNGDIRDFIDVDPYDSNTQTRSTSERSKLLQAKLNEMNSNFDSLFSNYEYTPEQKQQSQKLIQEAIRAIGDGSVSGGDYLALNRLAQGLDFRTMFTNGIYDENEIRRLQQQEEEQQQLEQQRQQESQANYQNFLSWLSERAPVTTNLTSKRLYLTAPSGANASLEELNNLTRGINPDTLLNSLKLALAASDYTFSKDPWISQSLQGKNFGLDRDSSIIYLLNYLKNSNKLISNGDNQWVIPGTDTTSGIATVWDAKTNTLNEVSVHDIPYYRNQLIDEYQRSNFGRGGSQTDYWTQRYDPSLFKNGGVIKAQSGTKFNTISEAINYFDEDLTDNKRLRNVYNNGQFSLVPRENVYATDKIATGNNRYDPELGGKQLEQQGYYNTWKGYLTSNPRLAEAWANRYKALQPTSELHYKNWYNQDGTFNFDNFKKSIVVDGKDTGKTVYSDQINGIGHDIYRGRVYQVKGQDGYYSNPLEGYDLVGDPTLSDDGLAYIYQMIPSIDNDLKTPSLDVSIKTPTIPKAPGTKDPSKVDLVSDKISPKSSKNWNVAGDLASLLLPTGRLFASLRTNNNVARTIDASLKPVLKNTYELYSPVTGDFAGMKYKNQQAVNIRSRFSKPFTSDASLQLAGQMDAERQAIEQENQGFQLDNAEIKRTQQEALKRTESNIARRSDVANFNSASINQTNRDKAELEATRLKQNWISIDNYLKGIEQNISNKLATNLDRRNNFRLQTATSDIDQRYQAAASEVQDKINQWSTQNPNKSLSQMPGYSNYSNFMNELANWRQAQKFKAYADVYGERYNNEYLSQDPLDLRLKYSFKNGGQLRPSTMYLINKVINNETNS